MAEYVIADWSQGLISSDDDINGRKNGFLRFENVELDQNGALVLTGGTVRLDAVYNNNAHTVFSKFLGSGTPESPQYRYVTLVSGNLYRSSVTNSLIKTGGSSTRTAYCAAYDYVLMYSGNVRGRDDGTTYTDIGQGTAPNPAVALGAAGILNATYNYVQVNVFTSPSGAYMARSAPSAVQVITPANQKVTVTPGNVSGIQNEVWIFRRGGTLQTYYRVKRILSSYTTPFDDNLSDEDALNNGVTLNILAVPVDSTNLPQAVLEAVGPINGRIMLFTANTVFFTELNSPESYVPGQGIYFMGSPQTAEVFLWAKRLAQNVVLIGTTKDVYRCTGTMIEQFDGTLDVSIVPCGVDGPPISIDADIWDNQICYMSSYGWVLCDQFGATTPLCPPNIDVNYYGKTRYGIQGVPIFVMSPDFRYRYSCAVVRNKLFTIVPEGTAYPPSHRVDVYDFVRKYWRSIRYVNDAAPLLFKSQEDHTVIGFDPLDLFVKRYDDAFTFTFANGPAVNQTVTLLTPFYDAGLPRNRKDVGTLKFKIDTGNVNCAVGMYLDANGVAEGGSGISLGNIKSNGLTEVFIDLNTGLASAPQANIIKSFQLSIQGTVPVFRLSDISITYEERPTQETFHRIPISNFDIPSKKRARVWPFVIDPLTGTVTITPTVDGAAQTGQTVSGNKQTSYYFFKTDVFGTDYGAILTSSTYFELYDVGNPDFVQQLPIPRQFDQVGPEDMMRYGRIKLIEVRLLAFGTTIPWTIFFQDASQLTGNLTTVNGVEDVYQILVSKTTAGQIMRFVLGPTSFNFHRYYIRIQAAKSGLDTDMEWITVPNS